MTSEPFVLPGAITGFGIDVLPHVVEERRSAFLAWARAVASTIQSPATEVPRTHPTPSFDVVHLERVEIWLLHNRFIPLIGALPVRPEAGPSWAVAGRFSSLDAVPPHVASWGPQVVDADELNRPLNNVDLEALPPLARAQADRYKPHTVGNVIFNYWT